MDVDLLLQTLVVLISVLIGYAMGVAKHNEDEK